MPACKWVAGSWVCGKQLSTLPPAQVLRGRSRKVREVPHTEQLTSAPAVTVKERVAV